MSCMRHGKYQGTMFTLCYNTMQKDAARKRLELGLGFFFLEHGLGDKAPLDLAGGGLRHNVRKEDLQELAR
jgi:hypothetical protein